MNDKKQKQQTAISNTSIRHKQTASENGYCFIFLFLFFFLVRASASKFNLLSLYLPVKAYQSAEVLQRGMVEIARGQTALSGQQASLLPGSQKVLIGK